MATAADILGTHLNSNGRIPARWSGNYQRLCDERDRLLARDCSTPETSSAKMDDLADAAAGESQMSMSLVTASATQDSIVEVVEAIRRIEQGTYGICEITGEPIEAERLRAIPWARYSFQGQNELEQAGLSRRHALPALGALSESSRVDGEESEAGDETD